VLRQPKVYCHVCTIVLMQPLKGFVLLLSADGTQCSPMRANETCRAVRALCDSLCIPCILSELWCGTTTTP